mmetsp:Transcript_6452/g.24223  ORF Transcript_6452/g.24223 Transcript_6452/m.24223 type:complete len:668 (+) Transcript_6452:423-2426(+)
MTTATSTTHHHHQSTHQAPPPIKKLHFTHSNGKTQREEPGIAERNGTSSLIRSKFRDSDAVRSAGGMRRKSASHNASINSSSLAFVTPLQSSSAAARFVSPKKSNSSVVAKKPRPKLTTKVHNSSTSNLNSYALNTTSSMSKLKLPSSTAGNADDSGSGMDDASSVNSSHHGKSASHISKPKRRQSAVSTGVSRRSSKKRTTTKRSHNSNSFSARSSQSSKSNGPKSPTHQKKKRSSKSSAGVNLTPLKLKLKVQQKLNKLHQSEKPKLSSPRYKSPTNARGRRFSEKPSSSASAAAATNGSLSPQRRRVSTSHTTTRSAVPTSPATFNTPMDSSILDQCDINSLSNIFQNPEKDLINKLYSLQKHRTEKIKDDKVKEERDRQHFRENELRMIQSLKDAANTDLDLSERLNALRNLNTLEQRDVTTEGYERKDPLNSSTLSAEWSHVASKFMQHFDLEYHSKILQQQREREQMQLDEFSFKPELNHNMDVPSRLLDHMKDPKYNPAVVSQNANSMQQQIDGDHSRDGAGATPSTKKLKTRKPNESFKRLTSPPRRQAARATSPRELRTATSPIRRPLSPKPNHTLNSSINRTTSPRRVAVSPIRSRMSAGSASTSHRRKLASPKRIQQHKMATPLIKRSAVEVRSGGTTQQQQSILLSTAKGSFVDL